MAAVAPLGSSRIRMIKNFSSRSKTIVGRFEPFQGLEDIGSLQRMTLRLSMPVTHRFAGLKAILNVSKAELHHSAYSEIQQARTRKHAQLFECNAQASRRRPQCERFGGRFATERQQYYLRNRGFAPNPGAYTMSTIISDSMAR